jgi:short-subunit dehydrogenase
MASYKGFSEEEIDQTVNLNCKAPVLMCNLCIPYMSAGSHILNLSSASAFQPNPYINLYAASKVFERSYSRALNVELQGTGIITTAVCPSWVDTDILSHEVNGKSVKFPGIVTADRVVKKALRDAQKGKDMSVCSFYVKCQHLNVKLLPQRLVMKLWMRGIRKYIS